jgi:hypothetical protein
MGIFEALMLIAFGSAWPVSIVKSFKARSNKGKSLVFLVIVLFGYLCGIVHKVLNDLNWVVVCYIVNACLVSTDIAVWFRNRKIEKSAPQNA